MLDQIARHWGTTAAEREAIFPGDSPDDAGAYRLWRGVDVEAPAARVFGWLCQLRVAPYSYDWIDNGGRRSPQTLDPGLERLERGQVFMRVFVLESFEPGVQLTLATPVGSRGAKLFGGVRVTYWARAASADRTRLLAKLRVTPQPGAFGRVVAWGLPWGDLVMMRRQLLNLKALAEARAPSGGLASRREARAWRREARAVRAVLGRDARVVSQRELQRRRNRRTLAANLASGESVVVKYYWRTQLVAQEAERLRAANAWLGVDTPRLLGCTGHHLVQECVAGESLDAFAKRTPREQRLAPFLRAAHVLAAIHGQKRTALAALKLTEVSAPSQLAAHMRRAWSEIETLGFAHWEAQHGGVPERWRRAFGAQRIEQLVRVLAATGDACVIGHGDFQPRHLVLTREDRLFVIDWSGMSLVSPWIELAQLLRWLPAPQRSGVTAAYLEAMQQQALLAGVSLARADSLCASALDYARLNVAKHRVRKLARGARPEEAAAFRASLDALAESGD